MVDDEEREMEESGGGSGNEDDRFELDFEEPWANPQEELLVSEVLSADGLEAREGVEFSAQTANLRIKDCVALTFG